MADASLNFDENLLDKESSLYQLYTRLYAGMVAANEVTAPDITTDPPLTESGEIDAEAIAIVLKDYSTTLMKNSAFLFANSISNCIDVEVGGIDIDTSSLLSRNGDSMLGLLSALYGFRAGVDGTLVFSVGVDGTQKTASVNGRLDVSAGVNVIGEKGLMFGGIQAIYKSQNQLNLQCDKISLIGNTKVDGELNVGYFKANDNGIYYGDHDIYHGGNANRNDVDWKMFDAFISGDLDVAGETLFHGNVVGLEGVSFGYGGAEMISTNAYGVKLSSDLYLTYGYGIKLGDVYVIKAREFGNNIVSFSAPGMIMNLGDSDGEQATTQINLQTGICNNTGAYQMVSQIGDGYFPNSFKAGCGNAGPTVLQTYYKGVNDYGFISFGKLRFEQSSGPYISADIDTLVLTAPYKYVDDVAQRSLDASVSLSYSSSTSLFKDLSLANGYSAHLTTDAEMFVFDKSVESPSFAIISERYKTMLMENALLFGDGIFLEGVVDGILQNGNAYFSSSLGSTRFASGFAGYGWKVGYDAQNGGVEATFDCLTIRKKARFYELEVQKMSVTNGSLWVSDACSGDMVEEIM